MFNVVFNSSNAVYLTGSFIQDFNSLQRTIKRIVKFILKIAPFLSQGQALAFGLTDLFVQGINKKRQLKKNLLVSPTTQVKINNTFNYQVRGTLLTGSGFVGELSCYMARHPERYNRSTVIMQHTANALFIFSNFMTLWMHIQAYHFANQKIARGKNLDSSPHQRMDAIFGMITSFGYILSSALAIMEVWTALALCLGFIAFFTGVFQWIYEGYFQIGAFAG